MDGLGAIAVNFCYVIGLGAKSYRASVCLGFAQNGWAIAPAGS